MTDANRDIFPFLSLPKELRLMIYEFMPIETRHHSITYRQDFEDFAFTIISKRLHGASLLAACKQVYSEATALRSKREVLNAEPLRIIAHWRTLCKIRGCLVMKAILRCASRNERTCGGNKDLEKVMQEMQCLREGSEYVQSKPWYGRDLKITGCDFNTHEELHALLRYNGASGTRRRVEVAVDCPHSTFTGAIRTYCIHFYNWLSDMHQGWTGDVDMHINLRPMPQTNDIKVMLEVDYEFWNEYNPPSAFRGRKWSYELGDWVEGEEWEEVWAEGEKF